MSKIDWLILGFGVVVGFFIIAGGFGMLLLIRAFIRWVLDEEDDTLSRMGPRGHTRIHQEFAHGTSPPVSERPASVSRPPCPLRTPVTPSSRKRA